MISANLDDSELVQRCLAGDKDAFGELMRRYESIIFSDVLAYVKDPEEARDITSKAFLKGCLKLKTLKKASKFKSWIRRIAYHLCIDWLRSPTRREMSFTQALNDTNESDLLDSSCGVEEVVEERLRKEVILRAVDSLPPDLRSVIYLRFREELSYEEISTYLKVPLSTVKWRIHNAIKLLRKKLGGIKNELF